jgi:diguanylate cyclase (GGDEF)-like protein/PAS domain S-box-containing protein
VTGAPPDPLFDEPRRAEIARRLFFESPVGMVVATLDGTVLAANPTFCSMVGRRTEEVVGHRVHEFAHPDEVCDVEARLAGCREQGQTWTVYERRFVRPDGGVVWALVSLSAFDGPARESAVVIGQVVDLTAHREAEARLAASERRFRTLVQHSADLVVELDEAGRARYVSPSVRRVLGYEPETFAVAFGRDLVHPADLAALADAFVRSRSRPATAVPVRGRLRHADGRWRTLEGTITNLLDDPDAAAVVVEARDVTDRLAAEEALRRSNELLGAFFERSPVSVNVCDTEGRVLMWSPAAERLFGWRAEEVVGGPLPFVPPGKRDEVAGLLQRALEEDLSGVEVERRRKDGTSVWVELSTARLRDASGRVQALLNVHVDVTARKKAEAALRASEERFRTLVDRTFDIVAVSDHRGKVTYVNDAVRELLGYEPAELVGSEWRRLIHPDDLHATLRANRAVTAGGANARFRYRARHRDGTWRTFEAVVADLSADPAVAGILSVSRDVTDQHRQELLLAGQTRVLEAIATDTDVGTTLGMLVALIEELLDGMVGSVLLAAEPGVLRPGPGPRVPAPIASLLAEGILVTDPAKPCAVAAACHRPVLVDDVEADARWSGIVELCRDAGVRSIWSIPIVSRADGEVLGTFAVYGSEPARPVEADLRALQTCGHLAAIAIERARSRERLAHQALHDVLTGLPNRALFADRLDQALARSRRSGRSVAVLFCDLDRFKVVNDSLGHDVGDRLLVEVAGRLRRALRPGDTVARFGGDEFTILCEDLASPDEAIAVAERVAATIARPVELDGEEVVVTASIGVAVGGSGSDDPDALVRDADTAMYRAKGGGRDRWVLFDERMRANVRARLQMEGRLRHAAARGELVLHYQPLADLFDGTVDAFEALLRWHHPDHGLLAPAAFLDVAEESGLIVPIGAWVINEACRQAVSWGRHDPDRRTPAVWVNLSARQLASPQLPATVRSATAEAGLPPERLCLEITESALMHDVRTARTVLAGLKDLGVRVAVDDFGTGYSSLSYLRRFPVDYVKVDRTFVGGLGEDPEDAAIVAAIVGLGSNLGLTVVAEGIETPAQLTELRALGCPMGQGFLLARPRPAVELGTPPPRRLPLPDPTRPPDPARVAP